jgi:hypothetical protein
MVCRDVIVQGCPYWILMFVGTNPRGAAATWQGLRLRVSLARSRSRLPRENAERQSFFSNLYTNSTPNHDTHIINRRHASE